MQTNNSQPQVLIKVGEKVRPIKLNGKQDVDAYLKAEKCILRTEKTQLQSEHFIPKKLFRFPGKFESLDRPPPTPARKRAQISHVSDNDIIQQIRLMSDDSDKVMDYVKGLLSSSKENSKKIQRNEFQYNLWYSCWWRGMSDAWNCEQQTLFAPQFLSSFDNDDENV